MKRLFIFILMCAFILLLSGQTYALENSSQITQCLRSEISSTPDKPLLSSMAEEECIEFVKQQGISIPSDYPESYWGPFVKDIIIKAESNPMCIFAINYTVTLEFANAIKVAVNSYYGIAPTTPTILPVNDSVRALSASLSDSVALTEWNPSHDLYNCYIYSIGTPDYIFADPGIYSGQSFSMSMSLSSIADLVNDDLLALNRSRITIGYTIDLSNLCTNEQVICLRVGDYDYHFMRYSSNNWLHKPGSSAILRYLRTMSNSTNWSNEGLFSTGVREGDVFYTSAIMYISYNGHNWGYAAGGGSTHLKVCSICSDSIVGNCRWSYTSRNDGTHTMLCLDCGKIGTSGCNLSYRYLGGSYHAQECSWCGYLSPSSKCTRVFESNEDGTHHNPCTVCGSSGTTTSCTYAYRYTGNVNGVNTHCNACTDCGYSAFGVTNCTYRNSDYCFFCGVHKDSISQTALKNISAGC